MAEIKDTGSANNNVFRHVYDDATYFVDSIVSEYGIFSKILGMMQDGNATLELKKRYLLRAIDETWVSAVEDALPALDTIIRNPSKFIEEREEILPIELSRNISVRSLQHLSQHTNFISKVEGDKITPSKILNVIREETMQTYENKFVNTLINRLYAFVNRRYEIASKSGQDEKTTSIEFNDDFYHDKVKVKMNFRIEIAESAEDEKDRVTRNYTHTTDLWHRVVKLNEVVNNYMASDFVINMGKSYIHPPVMRTNAILKNKNLNQCLALWQFIESYESAGYSMLVQEDLEKVDESYIKELYSTLALQYLIFRYNIHNEFDYDGTLASEITDTVLNPRIIDTLNGVKESEFDISDERVAQMPSLTRFTSVTPDDMIMLESIAVALDAAEILRVSDEESMLHNGVIEEPEDYPAPKPEVTVEDVIKNIQVRPEVKDGGEASSDNGSEAFAAPAAQPFRGVRKMPSRYRLGRRARH